MHVALLRARRRSLARPGGCGRLRGSVVVVIGSWSLVDLQGWRFACRGEPCSESSSASMRSASAKLSSARKRISGSIFQVHPMGDLAAHSSACWPSSAFSTGATSSPAERHDVGRGELEIGREAHLRHGDDVRSPGHRHGCRRAPASRRARGGSVRRRAAAVGTGRSPEGLAGSSHGSRAPGVGPDRTVGRHTRSGFKDERAGRVCQDADPRRCEPGRRPGIPAKRSRLQPALDLLDADSTRSRRRRACPGSSRRTCRIPGRPPLPWRRP